MLPDEPEARGLLALMLLNDSRRAARVDADGEPCRWRSRTAPLGSGRISEGLELSERAAAAGPVGPYIVQARIAAAHATAPSAAKPTGRGSSASTNGSPRWRRARWSSSTAPPPWR